MRRLVAAGGLALLLVPLASRPTSAHPLGNYTVNRAVAVTIGAEQIGLTYLVDMAEIPAFKEIGRIDVDGDATVSPAEADAYAAAACENATGNLELGADGVRLSLTEAGPPALEVPPGAGGLATLRLTCQFAAPHPAGAGTVTVADRTNDAHVGWREVTIAAGAGVTISDADVPAVSASDHLRAYPTGQLESPPDVRQGAASFVMVAGAAQPPDQPRTAAADNPRSLDPLAALLAGELSPGVVALALLIAAGLGAAHAISPGHGKTLVAAYLVGSGGTIRQAAALGLTVAFAHTVSVLVLGLLVLVAGELLLPETAIGWLTVASGSLMTLLGAGLLWRAVAARRGSGDRAHGHPHPHAHPHGRGKIHAHGHTHATKLSVGNVAALGVAGGLVPSASALIVLLGAITTGRLAFGLALIGAFGLGMALVLGGLAAATAIARGWLDQGSLGQLKPVRRALALLPIGSGLLVFGIGLAITITALGRFG
jgi:nickel/cobalt exporter